jgi:hypothetical protein
MIHLHRSATIAPGKMREAVGWSIEVANHVKAVIGLPVEVVMPIGGNFFDIGWQVQYDDLQALDQASRKLMSDDRYLDMLRDAGPLFVAGSTHEELWQTVG